MCLLAVDPGETTGFLIADVEYVYGRLKPVWAGEWHGIEDFAYLVTERNLLEDVDTAIVERYIIYPNRLKTHIGDSLKTSQMIGAIKYACWLASVKVVEQSASQAKQRWPDKRLWKYFRNPSKESRHTIDALRHLLTYLEVTYKYDPKMWLGSSVAPGK